MGFIVDVFSDIRRVNGINDPFRTLATYCG